MKKPMLIMGFNGGANLAHEEHSDIDATASHDAAAVLLDDGKVVAGIEQERLDRIKHSSKLPVDAMKFCLASHGARIEDVDAFAYYTSKLTLDFRLKHRCLYMNMLPPTEPRPKLATGEEFFTHVFKRSFGHDLDPAKLRFVTHHVAHAVSAFAQSGFDSGLVLTIDGVGEGEAGRVAVGRGTTVETLHVIRQDISLGHFYDHAIAYLGFKIFDEYKVMGLAPYGDPSRFRDVFRTFYDLLPNGAFATHPTRLPALFGVMEPRKKGDPITQAHMDVAAALQEALETIVFHVLAHYRKATGQTNLCLAGGVAHNCTMNGKIVASGLFENVFVQPAAHDAGCALGAALAVHLGGIDAGEAERKASAASPRVPRWLAARGRGLERRLHLTTMRLERQIDAAREKLGFAATPQPRRAEPLEHLYWGTDVGSDEATAEVLSRWRTFVDFERVPDITRRTAELLAGGSVIGWVQGRSEFGPRALGNRSILADPRPPENKEIINAMVKKREGFRPFAPSVLEEDVDEFFDLHGMARSPFMIFVVKVREDKQKLLGAVTHVDGSARVQTVSRRTNARYWELIHAFRGLTGVPVLLNTSFNNNAEPIVDSAEDAVVCFLTTNLHYLVVGDHLVRKKEAGFASYVTLAPTPLPHVRLSEVKRFSGTEFVTDLSIGLASSKDFKRPISKEAFDILIRADGETKLGDLLRAAGVVDAARAETVVNEVVDLWSSRLVAMRP